MCDRIVSSVLDGFVEWLSAEMSGPNEAPALERIRELAGKFKEENADQSRDRFSGHLDEYLLQLENEIWDKTRRRPFDRLLVKRFAHLFPLEGGPDADKGVISRRILPGFFKAMEHLAGPELFKQCRSVCKEITKTKKSKKGQRLHWDELYKDDDATLLVDDLLVTIATRFGDFHKRCKWLYIVIDGHHALPEDYEFEYGAADHWSLSEQGIYELLQALFARFRDQLEVSDGRHRIERRYGEKGPRHPGHHHRRHRPCPGTQVNVTIDQAESMNLHGKRNPLAPINSELIGQKAVIPAKDGNRREFDWTANGSAQILFEKGRLRAEGGAP